MPHPYWVEWDDVYPDSEDSDMAKGTKNDRGEVWVDGVLCAIDGRPVVVEEPNLDEFEVLITEDVVEEQDVTPLPEYADARRAARMLALGCTNGGDR